MSSSIPSAIDGLIAIATAALPQDATVWFGKALPVYTAPITLQVLRVTGEQEVAELGPSYRREETFEIHCELASWAGDQDHPGRMHEVYVQFAALTVAIATNFTLNGAVRYAQIKSFDYEPDANANGSSLGRLVFAIECQARIDSLT